jgi:regulator of sirC expression with transglutaminase-like and TPR domain
MVTSLPNRGYGRTLDVTARFAELVARPEAEIALDEAALLLAAHAHPDLDVERRLGELDALATRAARMSAGELSTFLFVDEGFQGNESDYGDPRNSFLDDVLDRRLGIPISLSVVMLEVGRRIGVVLHGVGMPGHFLVGGGPGEWFDPYHGGARLDLAGCAALFTASHANARFRPQFLMPVGPRAILQRMLANLQHTYLRRDPKAVVWVARLRLRVPGITLSQRGDLAGLLGRLGQFAEAARELDVLAQLLPGEGGEQAASAAAALRARAN